MILILSICVGLCIGSFIHLAYDRFLPHKMSSAHYLSAYLRDISFSQSSCPSCDHKLHYWQLIPIISWIILRGRCYYCQSKINLDYLVMELITAVIFAMIALDKGINVDSILLLFLACWFILLALIDFKYYLLPDFLTQPIMWLGLFLSYCNITKLSLEVALTGVFFGYFLLKMPAICFYWITKKNGLGSGDIKLLAALGAWIPYFYLPIVLIIACLLGIIYFISVKYGLKNRRMNIIPFGPFLLISGYIMFYYNLSL